MNRTVHRRNVDKSNAAYTSQKTVLPLVIIFSYFITVKPVYSGHSKKDKTKVLKANDSLMKVKSIAECSFGAFCNTFDLH